MEQFYQRKHARDVLPGIAFGLEDKKEMHKQAVATLANDNLTTLVLVSRSEVAPLKKAERASKELADNQLLIINGVLSAFDDDVSESLYVKQQKALAEIATKWWIINSSLYSTETSNQLLKAKASHEVEWINKVDELFYGHFCGGCFRLLFGRNGDKAADQSRGCAIRKRTLWD